MGFIESLHNRVRSAAAAFKGVPFGSGSSSSSGGGLMGNLMSFLPGASYDYEKEVGDLWKSSLVLAGIKWAGNTLPEARPWVRRYGAADQKPTVIPNHDLVTLLNKPNQFWDGSTLWAATILSDMVDGNAYWLKVRSASGKVVELHWLPHFAVEPKWDEAGREFITHYDYQVDGRTYPLAVEDVVHFRNGVDPNNRRKGLAPLAAVKREISADNEASTYAASLLRNMGIPGLVIKPAVNADGIAQKVNEQSAIELQETFEERFTKDNRGKLWVLKTAMDIMVLSFSPKDMALDVVRRVPEERVAAAIGIPAIVLGFGAGLARSTFANMKEAREAAYESCIVPMQHRFAAVIDLQLLSEPQFNARPEDAFGWDLSEVRALQDDLTELFNRAAVGFAGDFMTRNEARQMVALPPVPGGDVFTSDLSQAAAAQAATLSGAVPVPDGAEKMNRAIMSKMIAKHLERLALDVDEIRDHLGAGLQRHDRELEELDRAA